MGVWLKPPPTPPTIISSQYQLNKQVEQSGEFISIKCLPTLELLYLDDPQGSNANSGDKTVISGLCWYACDRHGLLINLPVQTFACVGGDLSQTGDIDMVPWAADFSLM